MATSELDQMKQGARATWAAGDYPAIAQRQLWPLGERIVRRIGIAPGDDVLDVACGTGNAALRAAQAGGRVTGVDLTPELLEEARRLAGEAGVDIEYLEGDAEALPVAGRERRRRRLRDGLHVRPAPPRGGRPSSRVSCARAGACA